MRVVWTKTAVAGVTRIYDYLVGVNPNAAFHVAETLMIAGDSLVTFPHRGRAVSGNGMRELVAAYPYILRYRIDGDIVVILRVRHTSRRPTKP